jgi:hypothetical protein
MTCSGKTVRVVVFLAASVLVAGVPSLAAAPVQAVWSVPAKTVFAAAPVPPSLKAVESEAEDVVDFALARNRGEVAATAASLKVAANGSAAAALARYGVSSATITQLEQRADRVARLARRGSFVRIALAANAVSGLMADLYGHFHDRVPASVLALDYLDREAQLRSLVREPELVSVAVRQLASTWTPLRPKVIAAGGEREAEGYDRHVAAMKRLVRRGRKSVQAEAVHGLDLVDRLEQVFVR